MKKLIEDKEKFISTTIRWAFGILFVFVAVKKFRGGYFSFADGLVSADTLTAKEIPNFLLYLYGAIIPALELIAGIMLLVNKKVKLAYALIAATYLSFIFGQMYNLNTSKIGTEYFPSLLLLLTGFYFYDSESKN
jgi:uncharacterized membrane protein YphA (DoxX/SURF4 family)